MCRRSSGLSRRQLLSAVAGAGAFSAVSGATTGAYLSDREGVSTGMYGGSVRISVECEDGACSETEGALVFGFDGLEPGTVGEERFHLSIDGNPVRVWIRSSCPPAVDPLGETLRVRLTREHGDEAGDRRLFPSEEVGDEGAWGTVDELRDALSDGLRLDDEADPCLSADDDVSLRLEYELPEDATWIGDSQTTLELELFAEQCRHVAEEDVENPFGDVDCPTVECAECVELGKVEVENDRLEAGRHDFEELAGSFAGDGHRYEIEVLTETIADEERPETICVAFRLLRDGDERKAPPLCAVEVAGGPDPGSIGPNRTRYDVVPPSTRTRGEVCAGETEAGESGRPTQPAISHLTVFVCRPDTDEEGGDR